MPPPKSSAAAMLRAEVEPVPVVVEKVVPFCPLAVPPMDKKEQPFLPQLAQAQLQPSILLLQKILAAA